VTWYEAQVHELQRALGRGQVDFSEQKVYFNKIIRKGFDA